MYLSGKKRKQGPGQLECMGKAEDRNDKETSIKSGLFDSDGMKSLKIKKTCLLQKNTQQHEITTEVATMQYKLFA